MVKKLKSGLKHMLYFLLFYSGVLDIIINLFKKLRKRHVAIIIFYHRFCNSKKGGKLLPCLDIKEFEKQVRHLKKHYKLVNMDELAQILIDGKKFSGPSVVLTIDDGYLDNYELAYPIFRRHNISPLVYVAAGVIGTRYGLWVDDVEHALIHAKDQTLSFKELFPDRVLNIATVRKKKKVEKMLYSALVKVSNTERRRLVQRLLEVLHVDRSTIDNRRRIMLNWEEIVEMSNNGVIFGAHTMSHPFLPAMPIEIAKYEIEESKARIEKELNENVKHFAIPNGRNEDFTDELLELCKAIGFDTIVTTEPGVVDTNSNRLCLKRVSPPPQLYYFACEIAKYFLLPGNYNPGR